jgi:hypothetical protein
MHFDRTFAEMSQRQECGDLDDLLPLLGALRGRHQARLDGEVQALVLRVRFGSARTVPGAARLWALTAAEAWRIGSQLPGCETLREALWAAPVGDPLRCLRSFFEARERVDEWESYGDFLAAVDRAVRRLVGSRTMCPPRGER